MAVRIIEMTRQDRKRTEAHTVRYNNEVRKVKKLKKKKPKIRRFFDWYLLAYIILILSFGLVMLFSASVYSTQGETGRVGALFFKQLKLIGFGLIVMIAVSFIPFKPNVLVKLVWLLYILSIILMFLVPKYGIESHNAKRWLEIGGQNFQPSELAKLSVILLIPARMVQLEKAKRNAKEIFANVLVIGFLPAVMAWKFTDNLSTGIIIAAISLGVWAMSRPNPLPFVIAILVILAVAYVFAYYKGGDLAASIGSETELGSFRYRRIVAWRDPYKFILGSGWQVIQGLYAIGSGGLLGKGLGRSTQKFNNIPEASNDFIFSIICEEMGFFGALLVVLLFLAILYRLVFIAGNTRNQYAYYILIGIFLHISVQVIFNISVVLNLIPTTGVSLPFISSGGTASILLLFEMGIALSISHSIVLND